MGFFSGSNNNNTDNNTNTFEEDIYSPTATSMNEENFGGDNSYEKLPDFMSSVTYDAQRLQPVALQGGLDFLQIEGDAGNSGSMGGGSLAPSRGWSDDLCYGTGTTYLAGLTLGGAFGMAEGLKKSASAPNMKVRLNTTLNSITRRGPGVGNSVGIIAMIYNGTTAMIDASRGEHDVFNSLAGGAVAGALFKSTAGPRAALVSAGVCTGVAGAWSVLVSAFTDN